MTGETSLGELFALIKRMKLLLTCDSAGLHIACDLGVKVAAIFGPTDPREYGPTGNNDIVIRKAFKCMPCKQPRCKRNHECMKQLNAEDILVAINNKLIRHKDWRDLRSAIKNWRDLRKIA